MDAVNRPPGLGSIRFLTGPLAGKTFSLTKPITTLGRDPGSPNEPGNDIVVNDPTVSRHHARIIFNTQGNGQWNIEKVATQNTVTVNQRPIQQNMIQDRDIIGLGTGTTFLFIPTAGIPNKESVTDPAPQSIGSVEKAPILQGNPPPPGQMMQNPAYAMSQQPNPPVASGQTMGTGIVPQMGVTGTERATAGIFNAPSLEITSNVHREKHAYLLDKDQISIGRDPSNDIVIGEPVVSGFHAMIEREGSQLVIVHPHPKRQQTLNGLLYQGHHIQGNQQFRKVLTRGDVFRIGDEHGTLITLTYNDGSGASQDILPEIRPVPLGAPVLTLGRLPDNTVILSHPQVSGHHARLEQIPGGYRILDLGSTNHIYVNTQRVTRQDLRPGDEIRIGPFKLTYTGQVLTTQDESNSIRIDATNLQKTGGHNTILINDLSLTIPPRKFVALVGGSGTGKSTLLDALNGLRPAQKGVVLYNGQDYYKNLAAFSTQLGYVPQDDIIHRDLTVERALYYAAKLRLPEDFKEAQIKQRINEVLDDVDMKHRRDLLVSKLSGGQRKRVSIALELLANPSVFFLDEPTSGLDPGLDRKMMYLLRRLADKGHTIVLVTHATNNINTCDYVCFLAQGGRLAYFGPPNEAKTYFKKTDFAEIYSALEPSDENPNVPQEAEAQFRASPDYQKYVAAPLSQGPASRANYEQPTQAITPPKRGNPMRQFGILSQRYLELLKNDVGNLLILLLQAPIIGLLLLLMVNGGVFNATSIVTCTPNSQIPITAASGSKFDCQNVVNFTNTPQGQAAIQQRGMTADQAVQQSIEINSGGDAQRILFIMAFAAIMFGSINGAREIVKEAAIYRRERTVNLGIVPYMFSKIVVLGILCLLQSLVLVVFVNSRSKFETSILFSPFIEIYITLFLTSIAGLMIGLTVSAIAPNNDRAMSFVPIILIPQVIFSGTIFALTSPLLKFLSIFFPARWAMMALGSTVGLHGDKLGVDDFAYRSNLFPPADQAGQALPHLLLCWFALIVMSLLLGLAIAYFLKRKDIRR
ncbi:MAG TPA: FHA domain-containing protein [Ktedonobacteraceae bacterium]|nr:FHA domain-containing protein [Ktedonobacteraceae bacterium]